MMLATFLQAAVGAALGNGVIALGAAIAVVGAALVWAVSVSQQWSQSHVSPRLQVISAAL